METDEVVFILLCVKLGCFPEDKDMHQETVLIK